MEFCKYCSGEEKKIDQMIFALESGFDLILSYHNELVNNVTHLLRKLYVLKISNSSTLRPLFTTTALFFSTRNQKVYPTTPMSNSHELPALTNSRIVEKARTVCPVVPDVDSCHFSCTHYFGESSIRPLTRLTYSA